MTGQEAAERLLDWSDDALHEGRSVRHFEPVYKNPAALRRDVRELLADRAALVAERDAQAGLAETRKQSRRMYRERAEKAEAELEQAVAERDRYRDALKAAERVIHGPQSSHILTRNYEAWIAARAALAVSTP